MKSIALLLILCGCGTVPPVFIEHEPPPAKAVTAPDTTFILRHAVARAIAPPRTVWWQTNTFAVTNIAAPWPRYFNVYYGTNSGVYFFFHSTSNASYQFAVPHWQWRGQRTYFSVTIVTTYGVESIERSNEAVIPFWPSDRFTVDCEVPVLLQTSTNLVDWKAAGETPQTFVYTNAPRAFIRGVNRTNRLSFEEWNPLNGPRL